MEEEDEERGNGRGSRGNNRTIKKMGILYTSFQLQTINILVEQEIKLLGSLFKIKVNFFKLKIYSHNIVKYKYIFWFI